MTSVNRSVLVANVAKNITSDRMKANAFLSRMRVFKRNDKVKKFVDLVGKYYNHKPEPTPYELETALAWALGYNIIIEDL